MTISPSTVYRVAFALLGLVGTATAAGIKPFLNMPTVASGAIPKLLSETGAFSDLQKLTPAAGLVGYEVNISFWADGARKTRWIGLPAGKCIDYSADGDWSFPAGTVFVKHFDLPETSDSRSVRLETRILVRGLDGGVYGATYRWREDDSDADLVRAPMTVGIAKIVPARQWYYPGPQDCQTCHTPASGGVLGVKTRQLNRPGSTDAENQLLTWHRLNLFSTKVDIRPQQLGRLAAANDITRDLSDRARSYLDANCSNCHRPGGVAGSFDARFNTPLSKQNLLDGAVMINLGIDHAKVIAPADVWRSLLLARVETLEGTRMPPLGHLAIDKEGADLLRAWIQSLPGKRVLAPPNLEPAGGEFRHEAVVTFTHPEPGAQIHYTLDGALPTKSSPVYAQPLHLTDPVTVRARAFKDGMMQSIASQEMYIITD